MNSLEIISVKHVDLGSPTEFNTADRPPVENVKMSMIKSLAALGLEGYLKKRRIIYYTTSMT